MSTDNTNFYLIHKAIPAEATTIMNPLKVHMSVHMSELQLQLLLALAATSSACAAGVSAQLQAGRAQDGCVAHFGPVFPAR